MKLFTEFPQTFRSKVITIKAKKQDSFEVNLNEGSRKIALIWGSNSELNLKIKVYEALIVLKENSKISLIDVSAPHAPIVK
jgi:cell division protein FtsQ